MVVVVIPVVEGFSVELHFSGSGDVGVTSAPGRKNIIQKNELCNLFEVKKNDKQLTSITLYIKPS